MSKKTAKTKKTALIAIVLFLTLSICYAAPSFDSVVFTNPLGLGSVQTVSANISSNNTISSVNIEILGANYSMQKTSSSYNYTWTPQTTGQVTFKIYAEDNQSEVSTYTGSFEVIDLTPPQINSKSPNGTISGENVVLTALTSKDTTCKYDEINSVYSSMRYFFTGNTTNHTALLTHLSSGAKSYYIACIDSPQNIVYDLITFTINLPPSAQITISKSSPLKVDTYEVTVITSKPLSSAPHLQYLYDDEQKYYEISLIGQDSRWTGYLVVIPEIKDRVGSFRFSGTDFDGLTGTKITSGALFIVDTSRPVAPVSIDAVIKNGKVELSWFYDGEEADEFSIYRADIPGVEYVDYYDDDTSSPFIDSNIDFGTTYYYRVAAVDKAGNVGEISSEVHVLLEEDAEEETVSQKLSTSLEQKLNLTYAQAKTLRFDIEYTSSQLEKETDRFKSSVIKELNLIDNARLAKANAENIISELDALRAQNIEKTVFDTRINEIEERIAKIKKDLTSDIIIIDSLEFTQTPSQADITATVNEVLLRQDADEKVKENYTKAAMTLQDSSKVFGTVISTKLKSLSGDEKYVTLITKEVSSSDSNEHVILLESIPKTFAESTRDIVFFKTPKVLKDDPVVYWEYSSIETVKVAYYTNEKKDISDAKDAKSIILPDPVKFLPKKGVYAKDDQTNENKVTGNFVFTDKLKQLKDYLFVGIGLLVLSGLLVYYFFFINDSGVEQNAKTEGEIQDFRIITAPMESEISVFMPENKVPENKESSENSPQQKHLLTLIGHAEEHAENLRFEQAAKEYALVYSLFNSAQFKSPDFKKNIGKRICSLHKKISVKKNVERASESLSKKDFAALQKIILDLKDTHKTLSEKQKTPLKDYVQEYHDYYSTMFGLMKK